ncbi:lmo0937 family membrane protein [Hydrogenophaga sp. PAMC20947]|nr:lmo0937 family membrane protein [Hydrogenophaga sp. PAMC20947]
MLYTIAVVLLILWVLGLVTATTMGGLIHILLVIAIVMVLLRVITGRSPFQRGFNIVFVTLHTTPNRSS